MGNLICYISETEGRRKLKFGEVDLHICLTFLRKNQVKISDLNALLGLKLVCVLHRPGSGGGAPTPPPRGNFYNFSEKLPFSHNLDGILDICRAI